MSKLSIFVLINLIGELLVLDAYVMSLISGPMNKTILRARLSENWKSIYTISIIILAISYLTFFHYMVFKQETGL